MKEERKKKQMKYQVMIKRCRKKRKRKESFLRRKEKTHIRDSNVQKFTEKRKKGHKRDNKSMTK